jgi:outer membrane protein assembly factor BamB
MTIQAGEPTSRKPLRLWPGVVAVVVQWLARFVLPVIVPGTSIVGVLAGIFGGLVVLLWWLFFSRAPWSERLGAIALMVAGLFATSRVAHESIANGMMGMMLPIFAIPVLSLALVVWAVASRRLSAGPRRASMAAAILLACGVFTLLRTGGITGDANSDFHWRWTATPEERLLAEGDDEPVAPAPGPTAAEPAEKRLPATASEPASPRSDAAAAATPDTRVIAGGSDKPPALPASVEARTRDDWPGFRGPQRDGVIPGVRIETDWSRSPPVELWRRPIGPGWSSFAVRGDLLYTQEQRGDDEVVAAYNVNTGEPVWRHRDAVRFWESNAGAGPRATPTLSNDRVYTFGATGILNALDARDGSVVWSRNVASDTSTETPGWGFASSPLVVADVVIVAASGKLAAYDLATGNLRWIGPAGGWGYSSPHRVTIDGVTQILLLNGGGATSVAPADGRVLWEHRWSGGNIVQPAVTADGDVLIGAVDNSASGMGTRRIGIAHGPGGWAVEERWTSTGLKPSFNDYVIHKGHAFGFDGSILACIDLNDGTRKWKGGRYGHGQLVLLPDQDVLLVLSEEGELALVKATPDEFTELARFPAIDGKTWNHPVLVGDVLLVRNGEEMAAFRLARASR